MAHELEIVDGKARMAYVGATPWHGLGQPLTEDAPLDVWIKEAGLNWTVGKRALFMKNGEDYVAIKEKAALVREDDSAFFDVVGVEWEPIQNYQAFEYFDRFCRKGQLKLETAGSLKGGKDTWVMASTQKGFTLPGGDETLGKVIFHNPHQYAKAALIIPSSVRVVCNNTLNLALRNNDVRARKLEAKFNHVGEGRFSETSADAQLGLISQSFEEYAEKARYLVTKRCTNENYVDYIKRVYGLTELPASADKDLRERRRQHNERTVSALIGLRDTQPGADMSAGTYWQALQAVLHDVDFSPRRNVGTEKAIGSAWFGAGGARKIYALDTAIEMAA